jgi:hypothetical protein
MLSKFKGTHHIVPTDHSSLSKLAKIAASSTTGNTLLFAHNRWNPLDTNA